MVYFDTSDEWQRQTSLLLQARPTTTRITTKYKIPNLEESKYQRSKKRPRDEDGAAPRVPRATLVLKAYEPVSGACLKFKTDRAAEVGRLVTGLGRVGRYMAALPPKEDHVAMEDAAPAEQTLAQEAAAVAPNAVTADAKAPQASGTGAGKKKKKNKK